MFNIFEEKKIFHDVIEDSVNLRIVNLLPNMSLWPNLKDEDSNVEHYKNSCVYVCVVT